MLPSHAIGNFLFPPYEVVITSLSYSSALMSETIKCSIPLVDNNINIHRAIYAVCWQFWNFGQINAYFTAYKTYASNDHSYLAFKYTTLATRQRDVVVVRTALTVAIVVPSTMFKVYDTPNSETLLSKLFLNFPVVNTTWEAVHVQFPIRKLVFTIIPIAFFCVCINFGFSWKIPVLGHH